MTNPQRRVTVQWSSAALKQLKSMPPKVRKGLLAKADLLAECDDPRTVHKPLIGPLAGCYRITYGRYRAIYTVDEHTTSGVATVRVIFIIAGIRKARSREDVYEIARKIVALGVLDVPVRKPGTRK